MISSRRLPPDPAGVSSDSPASGAAVISSRRLPLPALLLGVLLPAAAPANGQFRVTVEEVLVDVVVTRGGQPLEALTAADFTLLDEGTPREVRLIAQEERPLAVLFSMDLSESVNAERRRLLTAAAARFVSQLSERDSCATAVFSSGLFLTRDFEPCAGAAASPFPDAAFGDGTSIRDALLLSTALVDEAPGRPVLILFTDGEDTRSWIPEAFLEEALRGSGAVLYVIVPPDARDLARRRPRPRRRDFAPPSVRRRERIGVRRTEPGFVPPDFDLLLEGPRGGRRGRTGSPSGAALLRLLAERSGGQLIRTRDEERLGSAYEAVLDEMRSRYVLAFRPDPGEAPGWRRLEVGVTAPGATVRARRGYLHRPPGG